MKQSLFNVRETHMNSFNFSRAWKKQVAIIQVGKKQPSKLLTKAKRLYTWASVSV